MCIYVQFSHSVMSDSLQPHEQQHTRLPGPSLSSGVCSNSCLLSHWCYLNISSSAIPFSSCPQSLPASGLFSNESTFHMRWPKYWSFSFSIRPSKEHPGLISFRMDRWTSLQSKGLSRVFSNTTVQNINSSALSFLHSPTLISIHDHWKNHSLD